MKKISLGIVLALSALVTTTSWAQTASISPDEESAMAAANAAQTSALEALPSTPPVLSPGDIENLERYIGNVYKAVGDFIINQNYQPIPNVNQLKDTNTSTVKTTNGQKLFPIQASAEQAKQETSSNLANSLQQFPMAVLQQKTDSMKKNDPACLVGNPDTMSGTMCPNSSGTSYSTFINGTSQSFINQASDTLYLPSSTLNNMKNLSAENKQWLTIPPKANDNILDFGALFGSPDYSTEQEQEAAKQFVVFAAQSTKDLTDTLTSCKQTPCAISQLHSHPNKLIQLKKSPAYVDFTLTMRSMLAIRSIAIYTLNQLIAERTPIKGLAAAAGLHQKDKSTLTPNEIDELNQHEASPLQVEAYQANHRIQDPNWYASVANASPATVQRNILIVLAEIEHQNYEAHLDRERLLAAITASNLTSNMETMGTVLQQSGSKLNTEINDLVHPVQTGNSNTKK